MEGTQNVLSEGHAASFTAGRSGRVVRHVACHLGQLRLHTASAQVGFLEAALRRQQLASYLFFPLSDWPAQCRECLSFDARCRCVDFKSLIPSEIRRLLRHGWWQGDCCAKWCGGKPMGGRTHDGVQNRRSDQAFRKGRIS
jgi:hypothetical protein